MEDSSPFIDSRKPDAPWAGAVSWSELRSPGLTPSFTEIRELARWMPRKCAVASYKLSSPLIWIPIIGGTGTGKSTIFNALCGRKLSAVGVERPKTRGPIAFGHRDVVLGPRFPFPELSVTRVPSGADPTARRGGAPGDLVYHEHQDPVLRDVILVDTPDVDSFEVDNRRIVEELYLLSDLVLFVTSQEKYADDVLFRFLDQIRRDGKPFFLLVNKVQSPLTLEDIVSSLRGGALVWPPERTWLLPFAALDAEEALRGDEAFGRFGSVFNGEIDTENQAELRQRERKRLARELKGQVVRLLEAFDTEHQAGKRWIESLDSLYEAACKKAMEARERHVTEDSRAFIQREIRKHFSRYDLLGKPRRMLAQVVLSPLRALGLAPENPVESHEDTLRKMRERMDILPIVAAIEGLNREVLEKLAPRDVDSPLRGELRRAELTLTREEIRRSVLDEQEKLLGWLEETFGEMARGIPRSKEIGIYSTSILWGGLIVSLEAAVGGGITLLEVVLDSAIAPFVTRGAVELFAYHELQRLGRQLAEKYRQGVYSVIRLQRDRYADSLRSLQAPERLMAELRSLARELSS
jgi:GTPase SAR1 family protein